jgi:hypothetical protein
MIRPARVLNVDAGRLRASMRGVPRPKTGRPPGRPKGTTGELLVQRTVYLRPDQVHQLEARAAAAAAERGLQRPDFSRVLRGLLDRALRLKRQG